MKKLGFTLAEVLLTLAIIGVVAALTIPAVITKVTQDQYVVALKKAYNTLKAVERESIQENGELELWTRKANLKDDFDTYFKPYFDVLKDCGADTDDGCFLGANKYKTLKGEDWATNINSATYVRIITSDGIAYAYSRGAALDATTNHVFGTFIVDVNGTKLPNKWGRDLFQFDVFNTTLGVKPHGSYDAAGASIPSATVTGTGTEACTVATVGQFCAARVLAEGAMNY